MMFRQSPPQFHTVRAEERLSGIAALHGVPYQDIVAANPNKPLVRLQSGETVFASLATGEDIALPSSYLGEPVAGPASVGALRRPDARPTGCIHCPGDKTAWSVAGNAECLSKGSVYAMAAAGVVPTQLVTCPRPVSQNTSR